MAKTSKIPQSSKLTADARYGFKIYIEVDGGIDSELIGFFTFTQMKQVIDILDSRKETYTMLEFNPLTGQSIEL